MSPMCMHMCTHAAYVFKFVHEYGMTTSLQWTSLEKARPACARAPSLSVAHTNRKHRSRETETETETETEAETETERQTGRGRGGGEGKRKNEHAHTPRWYRSSLSSCLATTCFYFDPACLSCKCACDKNTHTST